MHKKNRFSITSRSRFFYYAWCLWNFEGRIPLKIAIFPWDKSNPVRVKRVPTTAIMVIRSFKMRIEVMTVMAGEI